MRSLLYFIKEALGNSKKNFGTTFGAIVTIFLSLLVIGVFAVCSITIDNIIKHIESQVTIQVFLSDKAAEADVSALRSYISGLDEVSKVGYLSKDDALEVFKERLGNPEIIEQLDNNPLPASLTVELKDPEKVKDVVDLITAQQSFQRANSDPDDPSKSLSYGQNVVDKLFGVANTIRVVCLALVVMLIFVALVFINNTIRLAIMARRKEIAIMRLVGASNGFIRGPFVMEGVIQAMVGAGLAILSIWFLTTNLLAMSDLTELFPWLTTDIANLPLWQVNILLIGIGLVIGLFGSAWAMRRYLKV
jgi:cell division transport system permease protein